MSEKRRVDRDTAEQLAAGHGVGPVASVLRAAAAPAHREELAGEEAAMAAFRAAEVAPAPGRRSVFRRALAKALTIKAVIVLAVAGSTGIVLAASDGALPVPWSTTPTAPPATTITTPPSAPPTPGSRTAERHVPPPAAPDPTIVDACDAFLERHLDNPAFRTLAEAAGGEDEIAEYCDRVEDAKKNKPPKPGRPFEHGDDEDDNDQGNDQGEERAPPPDNGEPPTKKRPSKPSPPTTHQPPSAPLDDDDDEQEETPDRSAPGAASAVPPSGAEPPSVGG